MVHKDKRGTTTTNLRDTSGKPVCTCDALPLQHSHLQDDGKSHNVRPDLPSSLPKDLEEKLRQLQMNIDAVRKLHHAKGLDVSAPYTRSTEDMLKLVFVNQLLAGLEEGE